MKRKIDRPRAGHRPEPRRDTARGHRQPESPGTRVIYGVLPVTEALRANPRRIERIMTADGTGSDRLSEIRGLAAEHGIRWDRAPKDELVRAAGPGANHQGILAITAAADYASVDEILDQASEDALLVVLDGVEDPRNFGAILRSAECAGADGVFIPDRRAVGITETVSKSSAGATEHIKVARAGNLNRLIEELKQREIWVAGASGDADLDYTEWDWTRSTALVLGGEGAGLHRLVAENCDVLVKIPMYGKIESLNVSVAAAVILFEARRQRKVRTGPRLQE